MTNLPNIIHGTEQQIAWATEIRAAYVRGFLAKVPEAKRDAALGATFAVMTTDASRWIDVYKSLGDCLGKPGETAFSFGPRTQAALAALTK